MEPTILGTQPTVFDTFNSYFTGPIGSFIGALFIILIGALIAGLISSLIGSLLSKVNVNQRMNSSTGKTYNVEKIIAKIVFWFILIIAISAALNQLHLDSVSVPFANMINQVLGFIPNLLFAVAIGVIGWVVATVVRTTLSTALAKTGMDERLSAEAGIQPLSHLIAEIIYWFILLIVLTMVLGQLELDGLFAPLTNMVAKVLNFIPNIFIAAVIFGVGYIIAKIVRSIITNIVSGLNVQSVAERAGISDHTRIASSVGTLAFLVIIITFLIAALDALKIEVISRPATNMLNQIMFAIPNIIAAAAILAIAYFVIKFVANIVSSLLENTGINDLPAKVGFQEALGQQTVSSIIGKLIIFFTMLFASIEAANRLGFERVSDLITLFISFGADIILGAIIMFIGFWLANTIAKVVERSEQGSEFLANIVRILIMGLVLAMGLRAMGIADSIVNLAFGLTLGAVAVAFALSFGLGGQEAAARFLRKMQDKMDAEQRLKANLSSTDHTVITTSTKATDTSATEVNTPSSESSTDSIPSVSATTPKAIDDNDSLLTSNTTNNTTSNTTKPSGVFDKKDLD